MWDDDMMNCGHETNKSLKQTINGMAISHMCL